MQIQGWNYYNKAAIPATAPHEKALIAPIENGRIWEMDGSPWLVRWTSDFDCAKQTNFWYVIKDAPFDISALKSKRRYEIRKGIKNFDVKRIDAFNFGKQLYEVQVAAFSAYPEKYRPKVDHDEFINGVAEWDNFEVYGAFLKEDGKLCGYSLLRRDSENSYAFSVQKTIPEYESLGVNFALVAFILDDKREFLCGGGYLCDGARSINHETNFQDWLEKYFGFRKAYCKLHIKYNSKIKLIIKVLFPLRGFLKKFDGIGMIHKVNGCLKMEEIIREQRKKNE